MDRNNRSLNPSDIHVRPASASDAPAIRIVHEQAFPTPAEADLVDLLHARAREIVSLVALMGDQIVGHILFTPVNIKAAPRGFRAAGLAPVGVHPEWQEQGVGRVLVRNGLARCREERVVAVVVLGEPAYYGRFGFEPASRFDLRDEYGGGNAFMAIELRTASLGDVAGTVRYCKEFNEVVPPEKRRK